MNNNTDEQHVVHAIQRRRRATVLTAISVGAFAANFLRLEHPLPLPMHTSILSGKGWLDEIIHGHKERCLYQLGMYPSAFCLLCWELMSAGLTHGSIVFVPEKVAIFLYWMVHGSSQRELMERFQHSGDTISKYTNRVLGLVCGSFYRKYVRPPLDEPPEIIRDNPRYFPFFRHCRGAVDGVHIDAHVAASDAIRYRDRKGAITQNVFAACDFELRFTYIMAGWEGTAADARLYHHARTMGFDLPDPEFFLADAGFANCRLLMTPFPAVRYHLDEWRRGGRQPENAEELFNLRHAKLRNAVERIFGVDKRRFRILTARPECSYTAQAMIVCAAAALHNFLRVHEPLNHLQEGDEYTPNDHAFIRDPRPMPDHPAQAISTAETRAANARRQAIADSMWIQYLEWREEEGLDSDLE
ncbi:putative nuclease HARBI1-like protein [Mycena kentingensis (nom. inval.)]|nr:putative nuclease HARBI1-like protein [Mycena kentingensis (nom. inval.)]